MADTTPLLNWLMTETNDEHTDISPNIQTIRQILEKTLADDRLSRSEKQVLRDCIWNQSRIPDQTRLRVLRRAAFDLISERMESAEQRELLEWLQDIVELLIADHRRLRTDATDDNHSHVLFSPKDPCADRIIGLIRSAKVSIDLCVFTITDNRLTESVLDAARRGLKVRVITDDMKTEDLGSDIERIAAAGVPVKLDRSPFHMHHKFAVFDRTTALTGSYNWTRNASEENMENLLVTRERQIVQPFIDEFERLWKDLLEI
ncbi:MAG: Phospholipase precursor [Planctomycetota bacterium]|jgi:phosphatidylserine/phosphatidylglycerophosphate/cardiolipin synthase-like enzyme